MMLNHRETPTLGAQIERVCRRQNGGLVAIRQKRKEGLKSETTAADGSYAAAADMPLELR